MKSATILFLSLLFAAACKKEQINEEFILTYGETLKVAGKHLKITFNSVEDSRCPKHVQCITEGYAKARFTLEKKGSLSTVELRSKGHYRQGIQSGLISFRPPRQVQRSAGIGVNPKPMDSATESFF